MTRVGSDSDFRDAFLRGAAKAFFVCAYADHCDEHPDEDLPRPRGGEDWYDFAPEPPPNAYAFAGEMWARVEDYNNANMYMLAERAKEADGEEPDPEDFGRLLAMQYMGTGVSWFDDHADFQLAMPHAEITSFSFDPATYRPETYRRGEG